MDRRDIIKSFLNEEFIKSEPFSSILDTEGAETGILFSKIEELLQNFFLETATISLDYWDNLLDLNTKNLSFQERRSQIKAKLISKKATTTQAIIELCNLFGKTYYFLEDFRNYTIKVFFEKREIIPDFSELEKRIKEVIPAHIKFEYPFNRYSMFNDKMTYDEMKVFTYKELRENDDLFGGVSAGFSNLELEEYTHSQLEAITHSKLEGV